MGNNSDDIADTCLALIARTETLSKHVVALINLNALLIRDDLAHAPGPL